MRLLTGDAIRHVLESKRVLGTAIAGTLLTVALVFLLPVVSRAREQARRSSCANDLANLVKCCQRYADTHDGCWPERLSQLYPKYMKAKADDVVQRAGC